MAGTTDTLSAPAALTLQGVGKRFVRDGRPHPVLAGIDLAIEPGEFVSLIGPSGCGKSTLLRLIAGLDPAHEGAIAIDGRAVQGPDAACGMLFQEHRLFPWLTVEDNVALGAYNDGLDKAERHRRVTAQLARVRLDGAAQLFPQQLSGGMAQRVSIARMLMGSRRLLLLDEPFSALDAFTRLKLQAELEDLWSASPMTMILVTHDIEEAAYLSDRIVVMDANPGRIRRIVHNPQPRPRSRVSPAFAQVKAELFALLDVLPKGADC